MAETSQKSEDVEVADYQEVRGPSVLLVRGGKRLSRFSSRHQSEVRQHGSVDLVEICQMSSWIFVGNLEKERGRRGGRMPEVRGPSVLLVRSLGAAGFPADADRGSDSMDR